ncbi:MAG: TonB-dependent receptor [Bacteroidota bacterium]
MKRHFYICLLLLALPVLSQAQKVKGLVTNIDGLPLIGANVYWQNSDRGTITDEAGRFALSTKGQSERVLVISYIGYRTETLRIGERLQWEIQLLEDFDLQTVEVTAADKATRFENAPAKVEVITTRELEKAACCSLAGCFGTNASVESTTTNLITNAKELQLLGLSGVYNQLLFEGLPLLQGLAYTYGIGSYPGPMIGKIYVAKGANSVLQGFESISGQINILPPNAETTPRLLANVYVNSFGENQYNLNYLHRAKSWNNYTAAHFTLPAGLIDRDGDGFRDVVRTRRLSVFNKWSYEKTPTAPFRMELGLRYWNENREGGQMDFEQERDRGETRFYGQTVDLQQVDVFFKINRQLTDRWSLKWINSAFYQDQDSYFGFKRYRAEQRNVHSSLYTDYTYGQQQNNLKAGASWRHNRLAENISFTEALPFLDYDGQYHNDYDIPGFFAEHTLEWKPFTVITGIRLDHHGNFGWKTTPRFLVRAALENNWDLRYSIGKGFRRVHLFSERVNLLAGNRNLSITPDLAPEEAWNSGLSVVKKWLLEEAVATLSADAYLTWFQSFVFPDFQQGPALAVIDNFYGQSVSQSLLLESKWEFGERLELKLAYTYLNVYQIKGEERLELPFVSRHNWLASASYATRSKTWQGDLKFHWVGRKILPPTDNYPADLRRPQASEAFGTVDAQVTWRRQRWEIYTGVENILDFRQEFPILGYEEPFGPYFDPIFNWGPTRGREFYLGLRYKLVSKS